MTKERARGRIPELLTREGVYLYPQNGRMEALQSSPGLDWAVKRVGGLGKMVDYGRFDTNLKRVICESFFVVVLMFI